MEEVFLNVWVIPRVLPSERGEQSVGVTEQFEAGLLLALKMEDENYMPRNTGGIQKLEKPRRQILPWRLQKGPSPANTLMVAQ